VFPVRWELNFYALFRLISTFKYKTTGINIGKNTLIHSPAKLQKTWHPSGKQPKKLTCKLDPDPPLKKT
jgi:hypothetical protein